MRLGLVCSLYVPPYFQQSQVGGAVFLAHPHSVGYIRQTFSVLQTEEFEGWLDDLRDRKARAAISNRLLQIEGGLLGDIKSLGGKVSEIRIHYGPGYRLYFTKQGLFVIVLLCGGEKGAQKRDLKKAREMASQL